MKCNSGFYKTPNNLLSLGENKLPKRNCVISFLLFAAAVFMYVYYSCYYTGKYSLVHQVSRDNSSNIDQHKQKTILLWTVGLESFSIPQTCNVNNCFVTEDRTKLPIEVYDALLFHVPRKANDTPEIVPSKRNTSQRYVFVNREAPLRFNTNTGNVKFVLGDFYNWTMTYKLDSDVYYPYGKVVARRTKYSMPTEEYLKNKTRSVAWVVSNCRTIPSRRNDLKNKLEKYIDVDVYGKCGNLTCSRSPDCYEMLERNYWFYLAFENSYCEDYATEKLYETLKYNMIPVVYGGGNYSALAPPHSVINVEEFEDVESKFPEVAEK